MMNERLLFTLPSLFTRFFHLYNFSHTLIIFNVMLSQKTFYLKNKNEKEKEILLLFFIVVITFMRQIFGTVMNFQYTIANVMCTMMKYLIKMEI